MAVLTFPVPYYLGEPELAPVQRLAFLSALIGAIAVAEGGGTIVTLAVLGLVQTLLFGLGVFALATAASRALATIPTNGLRSAVTVSIAAVLIAGSFLEIYDTALSSTRPRSSVLHLYE